MGGAWIPESLLEGELPNFTGLYYEPGITVC